MTSRISLYYWRQRYAELLPFVRESGVTPEEADDDECIRLLAEWNGAGWCRPVLGATVGCWGTRVI